MLEVGISLDGPMIGVGGLCTLNVGLVQCTQYNSTSSDVHLLLRCGPSWSGSVRLCLERLFEGWPGGMDPAGAHQKACKISA